MSKWFWSGLVAGGATSFLVVFTLAQQGFTGPSPARFEPQTQADFSTGTILFDKAETLYETLDTAYYHRDELDLDAMQESALKGFVDAVGDPYTVYLTAEENVIFDEGMQGSQNFEGIGAVVTKKEDGILIEAVLKNSPAYNSGIKPLDVVIQIDGELTEPLWLNEAVEKIRGPKGSEVVLTILRDDQELPIFDVTVMRDSISVPSAEAEIVNQWGKKILVLTVSIFGDDTMRVLRNQLRQVWVTGVEAIVLDLRGNGWGYLPVAVEVASLFLPKNEIVTVAKYSIFDDETFKSQWFDELPDVPVVVMVDELSASASEIVALALQERGNATILWEQSFGKWSIQTIQENQDGSSLKLTIWRRYSPSEQTIDKVWVTPDIFSVFDFERFQGEAVDTQRDDAIQFLVWTSDNE